MLVVYLSFEEFYFSTISFWWWGFFISCTLKGCAVSLHPSHTLIGPAPIVIGCVNL